MVPFVKDRLKPMTDRTTPSLDSKSGNQEHAQRADARRNRLAILAAAEAEFGARGPDAPMDDIAHRAGVGVGTLYRNFPTKEALLGAIVDAHVEPLIEAARRAETSPNPGAAFFALLHDLALGFADGKALSELIAAAGVDLRATKREHSEALMEAIGQLLARAQKAGEVRPDVTVTEVADMMGALCMFDAVSQDREHLARCIDLLCDGLRPRDAAPRSGAPSGRSPNARTSAA